jgi:hypothetical protein
VGLRRRPPRARAGPGPAQHRQTRGGLGLFFGIFNLAKVMDKPSTQPFADKTFPFDGLKTELGK